MAKPSKESSEKPLVCYTCERIVEKSQLRQHLYFGKMICSKCGQIIDSCEDFRAVQSTKETNVAHCQHTYNFSHKASEYISTRLLINLRDIMSHSQLNREMLLYIFTLTKLCLFEPWRAAIEVCLNSVKSLSEKMDSKISEDTRKSCDTFCSKQSLSYQECDVNEELSKFQVANDCCAESTDEEVIVIESTDEEVIVIEHSSDVNKMIERPRPLPSVNTLECATRSTTEVPKISKATTKRPSQVKDPNTVRSAKEIKRSHPIKCVLDIPANGYYLVLRKSIEECPMCYNELCPSRFTLNVKTFHLTTVCEGCGLTIFIIFTPPDEEQEKEKI